MKPPPLAIFVLLCAFALAGATHAAAPLRVVALHPILAEFATAVGGEAVSVECLVPGGVDPHGYEPAAREVAAARAAEIVLAGGLGLETYLERLADPDDRSGRLLRVGERLPFPRLVAAGDGDDGDAHDHTEKQGHDHASGERDPHWWHGLHNALFVSDLIRAEFTRLRPEGAAGFSARAQTLQQKLFALETWAAGEIAALPPERRHLVTSHDAFGYLARDFGFAVHSIGGLSTENETDPRRLARLITTVRRLGVKAVFADAAGSDRLVAALASETGVKIPAALYADGPGAPGSGVETYEAMYRHNLSTIVAALR